MAPAPPRLKELEEAARPKIRNLLRLCDYKDNIEDLKSVVEQAIRELGYKVSGTLQQKAHREITKECNLLKAKNMAGSLTRDQQLRLALMVLTALLAAGALVVSVAAYNLTSDRNEMVKEKLELDKNTTELDRSQQNCMLELGCQSSKHYEKCEERLRQAQAHQRRTAQSEPFDLSTSRRSPNSSRPQLSPSSSRPVSSSSANTSATSNQSTRNQRSLQQRSRSGSGSGSRSGSEGNTERSTASTSALTVPQSSRVGDRRQGKAAPPVTPEMTGNNSQRHSKSHSEASQILAAARRTNTKRIIPPGCTTFCRFYKGGKHINHADHCPNNPAKKKKDA